VFGNRRIVVGRQQVLSFAAALAVGLVAWVGSATADDKEASAAKCAKCCTDCMSQCVKGAKHCGRKLAEGNKHHLKCLDLCVECIEACAAADKCCSGKADPTAFEKCAKVCEACATECDKLDDAHMKDVPTACRECARMCQAMMKRK
jgi:hypothetical protein